MRVDRKIGQDERRPFRRADKTEAFRIEQLGESVERLAALDQRKMRRHHKTARRPEGEFARRERIGRRNGSEASRDVDHV